MNSRIHMRSSGVFLLSLFLGTACPIFPQSLEYTGSALWTDITDVRVAGNYAYCSAHNGLMIIDISNPADPQLISRVFCQGWGEAIDIEGNFAFIADGGSGLRVFDISNPLSPSLVGHWDSPAYALGVDVEAGRAYIADWWLGMWIVDVSVPSSPQLIGAYDTPGGCRDVMVRGNIAYIADQATLEIIDVTNPVSPVWLGSSAVGEQGDGDATSVFVQPPCAYVTLLDAPHSVRIVDITNPQNPVLTDSVGTWGNSGVWVEGNLLFALNYGWGGLDIFDITNPFHPVALHTYFDVGDTPLGVCTANGTAYVALGNTERANYFSYESALTVVDVSTPSQPALLGRFEAYGDVRSVDIDGTRAYAAVGIPAFRILDIADPANPILLGTYTDVDTLGISTDATASGGFAYTNSRWRNLDIVSVQNPANPVAVASIETDGDYPRLTLVDNILFVADGVMGVRIIDVTNPMSPVPLSVADTPSEAYDVAVHNGFAYVADGLAGLQVIDIHNVSQPQIVGSADTPYGAWGIAVSGEFVYVADLASGIQIFHAASPENPAWIGSCITSSWARDVEVHGDYLYAACGWSGVEVYDVSDQTQPALLAQYDTPGYAWELTITAGHILVADQSGLLVLRFDPLRSPGLAAPAPQSLELMQNYPNPFNASTTIGFALPHAADATLAVYDVLGRVIETLVDGRIAAGTHSATWNAENLPSGVYFARLHSAGQTVDIRMLLIR